MFRSLKSTAVPRCHIKSYRVRECDDFKPPYIELIHSTVQPDDAVEDTDLKLRFEIVKF